MNREIRRLYNSIKKDRFDWKRYLNGGLWFNLYLKTKPIVDNCVIIGYAVTINDEYDVEYNRDFKRLIKIVDRVETFSQGYTVFDIIFDGDGDIIDNEQDDE